MLWCSQVASGCENALRLRVYGTKAGIDWSQEDPNYLWVTPLGQPRYRLSRGGAGTGPDAARVTRVPAGHPEGYLEGFANIYAEAARAILARREGAAPDPAITYPGLKEGLEGVAFVDACVRSSRRNGAWVKLAL
jgi:predicted dehydrogenase